MRGDDEGGEMTRVKVRGEMKMVRGEMMKEKRNIASWMVACFQY